MAQFCLPMKITYRNKEESNKAQEREFLSLAPIERIYRFIDMAERLKNFPVKKDKRKKDNFIVEIKAG